MNELPPLPKPPRPPASPPPASASEFTSPPTDAPSTDAADIDPWDLPYVKPPALPWKMTPAVRGKLLEAIAFGMGRREAARWAGITPATFQRWLERGEESHAGAYRQLFDAVEVAEADLEHTLLNVVYTAAKTHGDWRAAIELLKRLRPERYGDKVRVDMNLVYAEADKLAAEFTDLERDEIVALAKELLGVRS